MTAPSPLQALVEALAARGQSRDHRQLLVLAGSSGWCREQAEVVLDHWLRCCQASPREPLWIGEAGSESARVVAPRRASRLLGSESELLVFDIHQRLDPDALAVASGTLRGGGLMLLLTPLLDSQNPQRAPFRRWFEWGLRQAPEALIWTQGTPCPPLRDLSATPLLSPTPSDPQCLSEDQARAVQGILRVVHGHRRRPLVLTADRGRGKSVALAIAAARLLSEAPRQLLITAPRREALTTLFRWLEEQLGVTPDKAGVIRFNDGELRFVPPDQLLRERPRADLLLVDEAAAIPAPQLEAMVTGYARIVFSTTVHGYEGTGRGFQLRFQPALQRLAPGWRALRLEQPVRWAASDPLERWVFDSLLLAATLPPAPMTLDSASCDFQRRSPEALLADPEGLSQLFALLVQAHYRTTPGDLRDLLDAPDLDTWVLRSDEQVIGAALVAREGGFDATLSRGIWAGRRRPRGHLLPQVLAAQAGWLQAPTLTYWRVVRIAVHPGLQGNGLGSLMLQRLAEAARQQSVDMLGSSFGFTPDLMTFWTRAGLQPLRLGLRRDASSGCHSLLVARPLTPRARELSEAVRHRFTQQLPEQLTSTLTDLDVGVVRTLLGALGPVPPCCDLQEWRDRLAFVAGQRGLTQCLPVLRRFAWELLCGPAPPMEDQLIGLLVRRLLQQQEWDPVCRALGLSGRRQGLAFLRRGLLPYVEKELPIELRDLLLFLREGDLDG